MQRRAREDHVKSSNGEVSYKSGLHHRDGVSMPVSIVKVTIQHEPISDTALSEPWERMHLHIWDEMRGEESDVWSS